MSELQPVPVGAATRAGAMLVGVAVGDALGWSQEQNNGIVGGNRARNVAATNQFRTWERNAGSQFSRYRDPIGSGEYSDDTQLTLFVARACAAGDSWWSRLTEVELPSWLAYQRGGGRAILSAARSWLNGAPPWEAAQRAGKPSVYFDAGSNGAAMRISPHVLVTLGDRGGQQLAKRVLLDSISTHGHMRALVGAVAQALLLRLALSQTETLEYGALVPAVAGDEVWDSTDPEAALPSSWLNAFESAHHRSASEAWREALEEFRALLRIAEVQLGRGALADDDVVLRELGCQDRSRNGAGTVSAAAAAYLTARAAPRPLTGLLRAAFLPNADTDTVGSMTAAALAALHGGGWMNALAASVQDSKYLESFGQLIRAAAPDTEGQPTLFGASPQTTTSVKSVREANLRRFKRALADKGLDATEISFVDGRNCHVVAVEPLAATGNISVRRHRLRAEDGQTIFVDHTEKQDRKERSGAPTVGDTHKPPRPAAVVRVTLSVSDLQSSAEFYRNVVGVKVRSGDGYVELADSLRLQLDPDAPTRRRDVLEIAVGDLPAVCARLGVQPAASGVVEVEDPDGRTVRLTGDPSGASGVRASRS